MSEKLSSIELLSRKLKLTFDELYAGKISLKEAVKIRREAGKIIKKAEAELHKAKKQQQELEKKCQA